MFSQLYGVTSNPSDLANISGGGRKEDEVSAPKKISIIGRIKEFLCARPDYLSARPDYLIKRVEELERNIKVLESWKSADRPIVESVFLLHDRVGKLETRARGFVQIGTILVRRENIKSVSVAHLDEVKVAIEVVIEERGETMILHDYRENMQSAMDVLTDVGVELCGDS